MPMLGEGGLGFLERHRPPPGEGDTGDWGLLGKLAGSWMLIFLAIVTVEAALFIALLIIFKASRPKRPPGTPAKTLIVLGSGGHTAEMLRLVGSLPKSIYCPRIYVAAATDALSGQKAMEAEKTYQADGDARDCDLYSIPRSREVGQSYFTSVFTTLYSMLYAFALVLQVQPEVVLVNGPGTCFPICLAAWILRHLHIRFCDIVYVESIARTRKLSLSGKLLYHLRMADVFLVQWEQLAKTYPRAVFKGRLY